MKCMLKTVIHDCCDVEDILRNTKHIPEWIHESFRNGVLVIDAVSAGGLVVLRLSIRTGLGLHEAIYEAAPQDGYIVKDEKGIRAMTNEEFDRLYDIID